MRLLLRRLWFWAGTAAACVATLITWRNSHPQSSDARDSGPMVREVPEEPTAAAAAIPAPVRESSEVREALAGLPPYKRAVPQPLDVVSPQGSSLAMAWFSTRDSPEEVLSYYERALREAGHLVLSHRQGEAAGYVGYLAPGGEKLHLISVMAQGGETLVFPSSAEPGQMLAARARVPASLPHPDQAVGTVVLATRSEGAFRYSVIARVLSSSLNEWLEFYRSEFQARGWEIDIAISEGELSMARLAARRGEATARVLLQHHKEAEGHHSIRVYVTLHEQP